MTRTTRIHMTRGDMSLRLCIASTGEIQAVARKASNRGSHYRKFKAQALFQGKAAVAAWINQKRARGWTLNGFTGARG